MSSQPVYLLPFLVLLQPIVSNQNPNKNTFRMLSRLATVLSALCVLPHLICALQGDKSPNLRRIHGFRGSEESPSTSLCCSAKFWVICSTLLTLSPLFRPTTGPSFHSSNTFSSLCSSFPFSCMSQPLAGPGGSLSLGHRAQNTCLERSCQASSSCS